MLIKHIPNIFEKEGRDEYTNVEWVSGNTIRDYCKQTIGRKSNYKAIINGAVVDFDYKPLKNDEIIFTPDVKDANGWLGAVVGTVLVGIGTFVPGAQFLVPVGIAMIAGAAVGAVAMALFAPETSFSNNFKDSKTYSWGGIQNIMGEGSPMPVVLGKHRVGGAILERFIESNGDNEELNVLVGLSEGPVHHIDTNSIQFNRQPISLFHSMTEGPYTRSGTRDQTPIENFSATRIYYGMTVNVELTQNTPFTYRINNPAATKARVHLSFAGLVRINDDGKFRDLAVTFRIQFSTTGTGSWQLLREFSLTRRTKSPFTYDREVTLPSPGHHFIRITRITEDWTGDTQRISGSYLKAVTETEDATVAYKNTALLGVKLKASELVSGNMPVISTLLEGVKIADIRTGHISITSIQNPANQIFEILTNKRWGSGKYITEDQIDIASLQAFADWCDESVNYKEWDTSSGQGKWVTKAQRRYQVNFVIDQEYRVIHLVEKICAVCRAIPCWAGNKFKVVIDRPQDTYAQTFTMGNIIADSFEEDYGELKTVTQIEAEFLDESDDYTKKPIIAVDKTRIGEPAIPGRVNMFGLTDRARVKRELSFAMRKLKALQSKIKFNASIDAVICEVGDLIRFQHDVPQYGYGGRVISTDGQSVTLDQLVPFQAGISHTLRIRRSDNTYYVNHALTAEANEALDAISIDTAGHDINVGDIWTFGPNGLDSRPYRILNITKASDQEITLEAENYNSAVYDDDANILVYENKYSLLGLTSNYNLDGTQPDAVLVFDGHELVGDPLIIPPYVLSVDLSESYEQVGDVWQPFITVNFTPVEMPVNSNAYIKHYEILYSTDDISWQSAGTVTSGNIRINGIEVGEVYNVVVKPYTSMGRTNNIEVSGHRLSNQITVTGKTNPPGDIVTFNAEILQTGIRLQWVEITDVDCKSYIVVHGGSFESGEVIYAGLSDSYLWEVTVANRYDFWIAAKDSWGNISANPAHLVVYIENPDVTELTYQLSGPNAVLAWEPSEGAYPIADYEISIGDESFQIEAIARIKSTRHTVIVNWSGSRKFWISAIDIAGNMGVASSVDINIIPPSIVQNIVPQVVYNNILLRWEEPAQGSLPLSAYLLRKGASFDESVPLGELSATFAARQELSKAVYRYWLAARDTAGNVGQWNSVQAAVDAPPGFVLRYDDALDLFAAITSNLTTNHLLGSLIGPYVSKTWKGHFTDNGWASPADQKNAGYPYYLQPAASNASLEKTIDFETVVSASQIIILPEVSVIAGTPEYIISLSTSVDGIQWINFPTGLTQVFSSDFRFLKVAIAILSGEDNKGLLEITRVRFTVSLVELKDSGTAESSAADTGGTEILFNKPFIDVSSINISVKSTDLAIPVYIFEDVPYPKSFLVKVFDINGNRVTRMVGWHAEGV